MKRYLMGAAVLAVMAASCQNEQLVKQTEVQQGKLFTLEVGKSFESRTVLNGTATHWCEDDAIYVSGDNGNVHGVLKFKRYGSDKTQAVFEGYVSGGQPSELQHIVFPVPQGGKIDMSKRIPGKLDAPMIGTIGDGAVQTLNNVGGLLTFNVDGGEGNKYGVTATTSGGENMTGGYYEFDAETGTLKYTPADIIAPIEVLADGSVYIPVATTTDPTDGDGNTSMTVKVKVVNLMNEGTITNDDNITITEGEIYGNEDGEQTDLGFDTLSEDKVETNWYDPEKTEFEISTAKQLAGFAKIVNENTDNFEGKVIKLGDNVDLKNIEWIPIGTSDKKFAGTFDGSEYKISNLTISDTDYAAFIAYTSEGVTVKNLTFENVNISSNKHAAGVVCIAGNKLTLKGITVTGMINAKNYAGGLVVSADNIGIDDCQNDANISAERAGGIASWIATNANVTNVTNNGDVTGSIGAGGIAHAFGGSIINAVNHGKITSNGVEPAAGIVGIQKAESSYKYCYNYENVTSTLDNPNSSAAGILGQTPGTAATLSYCANFGEVKAEQSYAGGIAYSLYGSITANYCYNAGTVTGADGAGAIAPKAEYGANDTAIACLNAGKLTSEAATYQGSNKNTNCYYYKEDELMSVSDNSKVEVQTALSFLNGGDNKEFFNLKDDKIIVKQ